MYVCVYVRCSYLRPSKKNNSHERADEAYALLKRKVFSRRQKDVSVNGWLRSDVGREFRVEGPTTAKPQGP